MDLNAPLGMTPPPPPQRRWPVVLAGGTGAAALVGLALTLGSGDPHGGRPFAIVELPPTAVAPARAPMAVTPAATPTLDPMPTGTAAASPVAAGTAPGADRSASFEGGVLVHRGPVDAGLLERPAVGGPLVIDVSRALDAPFGKTKGAPSKEGHAVEAAKARSPRVAIFVSGMGLDAAATRTAIDTMPAAVTLAFVPYGTNVSAAVSAAKGKGHEVLLQLPMRNDGGTNPGPHALRPDSPADTLRSDLAWLMARFDGYDGVSNLLGAAMTADSAAMTVVLKAVRARHVFYLDDGTSRRSVAVDLAPDLGADVIKADLVLDATADPSVVRANLDQLATIAKRKGQAIGMASGLPEHLGTIARFAAELGGKGIELVPINALDRGGMPAAPSSAAASR